MKTYFVTGFPGFLASRLLEELINRNHEAVFALLIHPSQYEQAKKLRRNNDSIRLFLGDITKDRLDLPSGEAQWLRENVTHVFHLAAIYDLAVPKQIAEEVNVTGTSQVNRFVQSLEKLKRYVYFSTAYVSGHRTGLIKEDELDTGHTFKNHYESTKFAAEMLVADLQDVPYTIIRPGIVVGHSKTGETIKFDGPYFIMRFLDRIRFIPIPYLGKSEALFNVVPVDYIINATLYLSEANEAVNRTFHLTDPSPYQSRQLYRMICEELLGKKPSWTLSPAIVDFALSFSIFRRFFKVEKEALEYLHCTSQYDANQAKEVLEIGGVYCPDFKDYVPNMVRYYKNHRHDPEKLIKVK